jgi:PAS domain S-box-containing protein
MHHRSRVARSDERCGCQSLLIISSMSKKTKIPITSPSVRRRAVARIRDRHDHIRTEDRDLGSAADHKRLLHALQVHQIELEMQNAELLDSRNRSELLLEKFTELYDFAPVGYFSLGEQGRILEVNLTGAALLGVERSHLINKSLTRFIAPSSRSEFLRFQENVLSGNGKQIFEALLIKGDATSFWASIHGMPAITNGGPAKCCRMTVSDITSLKQAEDVKRRLAVMATSNRALQKEITKRLAAEEALKGSERHHILLLEQSRLMQKQLRTLSHQILSAQEDERREISLELHDVISQTLIGINVRLAGLKREALISPQDLNRNIASAQRLVTKSVNIVHHFARELRPAMLDALGLIPALRSFIDVFSKRTKIPVTMHAEPKFEHLYDKKCTVLYRVAQESLNNVARHARASQIELSIRNLPEGVCMRIKDNGKSFDVARTLQGKGSKRLGLLGMRERLAMVGGRCEIESAPGHGTTITALIPIDLIKGG